MLSGCLAKIGGRPTNEALATVAGLAILDFRYYINSVHYRESSNTHSRFKDNIILGNINNITYAL